MTKYDIYFIILLVTLSISLGLSLKNNQKITSNVRLLFNLKISEVEGLPLNKMVVIQEPTQNKCLTDNLDFVKSLDCYENNDAQKWLVAISNIKNVLYVSIRNIKTGKVLTNIDGKTIKTEQGCDPIENSLQLFSPKKNNFGVILINDASKKCMKLTISEKSSTGDVYLTDCSLASATINWVIKLTEDAFKKSPISVPASKPISAPISVPISVPIPVSKSEPKESSNGEVYAPEKLIGAWKLVYGKPKQVAVGGDRRVWVVTLNDEVFTLEKGTWKKIDGEMKQIAVAQDGRLWAVNQNNEIYTREGLNGTWIRIEGGLSQIAVGRDGRVWGLMGEQIFTREGVNGTWIRIEGGLNEIAVGPDGRVWGTVLRSSIYTRNGVSGTWRTVDGNVRQIAVAPDGRLWAVDLNNEIFTREGLSGTWKKIDGNLIQIAVGPDGRVWGITPKNEIYGLNGKMATRNS
jgi:hypothetical protein